MSNEEMPRIVSTPGVIQTILMLGAARRADALQTRTSLSGETIPRRDALREALSDLHDDMGLCLELWEEAGVGMAPG